MARAAVGSVPLYLVVVAASTAHAQDATCGAGAVAGGYVASIPSGLQPGSLGGGSL